MKVAVVGATGLVGTTMLKILEEQHFPVSELLAVASEKSMGKAVAFRQGMYDVIGLEEAVKQEPDLAIFSAGAAVSREWAPKFAAAGTTVIDNSSCWRMDPAVPLIVPEINADVLTEQHKIIANPNCSTIQMVMVLNPLHLRYHIKRIVVSTYQSVSGTGVKAVEQLQNERNGKEGAKAYPHQIDLNCLPHIDAFLDNGYTKEEIKMVNETRKILRNDHIEVSPTAVRVPVKGGHSESVHVEFEKDFELPEIYEMLKNTPGVVVQDDPAHHVYPMPVFAEGKDDVFVGRIRRDLFMPKSLNCWIVADNLRKGAATNAVQIAAYLYAHHLVGKKVKA